MTINWGSYAQPGLFDEWVTEKGRLRAGFGRLGKRFATYSMDALQDRSASLERAIKEQGVTFTVYSEAHGSIDRSWPLDLMPRILRRQEWLTIEAGLAQRVKALNCLIDDLYHDQRCIKDGVLPAFLLENSANFRPQCVGVNPPLGVWAHICGSDLVRHEDGRMYVLEDNLRVPSGVSYMLENRGVMKRTFPELFANFAIEPVDAYPSQLYDTLCALAPHRAQPEVVVLTPGVFNSAYFEHAYLAQQMGCELVEGRDLVVNSQDEVFMLTTRGRARVDVIYRRIDDAFLDPEAFNKDSLLGVPGLMRAWKAGKVALANAPGAGVADDKAVYCFVPDLIRYYLSEAPLLPNVPSHICARKEEREYVLDHIHELVVKPVNESGGYGMLLGPQATPKAREAFRKKIQRNPRNYMAQPMLNLSTVPTFLGQAVEPRHVDLRPFILSGESVQVTTGGLTRVAMRKGSLVVNSSQGGGSKDTWVIDEGGR